MVGFLMLQQVTKIDWNSDLLEAVPAYICIFAMPFMYSISEGIAFGVISTDYHIQLYGYLQNKTGTESSVKDCDYYISQSSLYKHDIHNKVSSYKKNTYKTLPTYIRNAIDHPSSTNNYTYEELKCSTELLIELCKFCK